MKSRFVTILPLVVSVAVGANTSSAQNLVQNGSFNAISSYDTGYSNWTFTGGVVFIGSGTGVHCADGSSAIGLSWQTTLYQDIPTVIGRRYRFSFALAAWGPDVVPSNTVYVVPAFGSTQLGTVGFDGTGKTYQNMGWSNLSYIVTAVSSTTRIAFSNPAVPLSLGTPLIDNVWLTPTNSESTAIGGRVAAWGNNSTGQLLLPNGLKNVKQIAAGISHSLALKADGAMVGWGNNLYGAATVPADLSGVVAIAAGGQHSLALRFNGTVTAWGDNAYGQTNVPPYLSDVIQISAGSKHSLALKADGTLVGWGGGSYGEGYVPAGLSNVKAVVAGPDVSFALKRDGTVAAWGSIVNGSVPPGLSNVVAISSGTYQSLALEADGTVVAWGTGYPGQPMLPPGLANVVAISVGAYQSLALKADGTVVAWGLNNYGLTNIPSGLTNVAAIAAGGSHNLAIVADGPPEIIAEPADIGVPYQSNVVLTVDARGFEPLGYRWFFKGSTLSDSTRIFGSRTASLTISNAQFADAGSYRVVVSNALGLVQSTGSVLTVISPPLVTQASSSQSVVAGSDLILSVGAIGTPPLSYQWMKDGAPLTPPTAYGYILALTNVQSGQGGTYTIVVSNAYGFVSNDIVVTVSESAPYILVQPANVSGMIGGSARLSVTARGTLPLTYQWQRDGVDIPGATNSTLVLNPLRLDQNGHYTVVIGNAFGTTVSAKAFLSVSQVVVWGNANLSGLTNFPAGLTNVVAISAGNSYLLALRTDGTVTSWGSGVFGNLPNIVTNFIPTNVPSGLSNVMAISAGDAHCLALKSNGTVVAWGSNSFGQTHVPSGLSNVIAIAAGEAHSLALKNDGSIIGWGAAGDKFPLNGYLDPQLTNAPPGLSNITAIAAGSSHNIALKNDGTLVYWGATTNLPISLTNAIAVAFKKGVQASGWSLPYIITKWDYYSVLRADGTVVPWSDNNQIDPPNAPLPTVPGLSNAVAISGSMNLVSDGTVFITRIADRPPASVSNVIAIAAGVAPAAGASDTPPIRYPVARTTEFFAAVIGDGSPVFALQPASQTASIGSQVQLHARAVGVQPLQYQWQLNGTRIPAATNGTLILTNLQGKDAGVYRVVASNALGVVTSSEAVLTIPISLPVALNALSFPWTTASLPLDANAIWFPEFTESRDNDAAAQSGPITHSQQSVLQTTVTGPGTLTFWWKVSSEQGYDFLNFYDYPPYETFAPILPVRISGDIDWEQKTFLISQGTHKLVWAYSKDATVSAGRDAGWVDIVSFTRLPPPPIQNLLISPPVCKPDGIIELHVGNAENNNLLPEDAARCEVLVSTNLVNWSSFPTSLTLTNGVLRIWDATASNTPVRFYKIIEH